MLGPRIGEDMRIIIIIIIILVKIYSAFIILAVICTFPLLPTAYSIEKCTEAVAHANNRPPPLTVWQESIPSLAPPNPYPLQTSCLSDYDILVAVPVLFVPQVVCNKQWSSTITLHIERYRSYPYDNPLHQDFVAFDGGGTLPRLVFHSQCHSLIQYLYQTHQ